MFGGDSLTLKVFQIYVSQEYRGQGVGRLLIDQLVEYGMEKGCLTITARVASDLDASQRFWSSVGFEATKETAGGMSRNRKIILRARNLDTPSLLSFLGPIPAKPIKQFHTNSGYALDLNILHEVIHRREHHDAVLSMISAAMTGHLKLFITGELITELSRTARKPDDAFLRFALGLSRLPDTPPEKEKELCVRLRELVFPGRLTTNRHSTNDHSDLKHLAGVIYFGLSGFVTLERRILAAAHHLHAEFGIEIVTPIDLAPSTDLPLEQSGDFGVHDTQFSFSDGSRKSLEARNFLAKLGLSGNWIDLAWPLGTSPQQFRLLAEGPLGIIGTMTVRCSGGLTPSIQAYVHAQEGLPHVATFYDGCFESINRLTPAGAITEITILAGALQIELRKAAAQLGFGVTHEASDGPIIRLRRAATHGVVGNEEWSGFREIAKNRLRMVLPKTMPDFSTALRQGIPFADQEGTRLFVSPLDLEWQLAPVLFLFQDRLATLVPIRPRYAEDLLGFTSPQLGLLPRREAQLRPERVYFRSPNCGGKFRPGSLVLWYVSGQGKLVGISRISKSQICTPKEAEALFVGRGVFDAREIEDRAGFRRSVHVFSFNHTQLFRNTIPMDFLRQIGLGKGNFQMPESVPFTALQKIIVKGFGGASWT